MLRQLLGEPKREDEGLLLEAIRAIQAYADHLRSEERGAPSKHDRLYDIYLRSGGLLDALDELEQSVYASGKLGRQVKSRTVEEMGEAERDAYRLHVYFYKNAFIRLFSILDKLGFFLNELYNLDTQRMKSRFSYFTVIRNMRLNRKLPSLSDTLNDIRDKYRGPLDRLRQQRNMEIHLINYELMNDTKGPYQGLEKPRQVEELDAYGSDLQLGFEMVCESIREVFRYSVRHNPPMGGRNPNSGHEGRPARAQTEGRDRNRGS